MRAVKAFFAEFVGTFILVFTVFGVIHRKASADSQRPDQAPAPVAVPAETTTPPEEPRT